MVLFIEDVKHDIRKMISAHERIVHDADRKLSQEYDVVTQKEEEIRQIITNYDSDKIPDKQEMRERIVEVYAVYDKSREEILEQEDPTVQQSREELDKNMYTFIDATRDKYPELKVTWNSDDLSFDVVQRAQNQSSDPETASNVTMKSKSVASSVDEDIETRIQHETDIINQEILKLDEIYQERQYHVKSIYSELYESLDNLDKEDAASALERYYSYHAITIKELSQELTDMRNQYNVQRDNLLQAENTVLDIIQEHNKQYLHK